MYSTRQEVPVARSITKAKLLDNVAGRAGVSKAQAESVLSAFFDEATFSAKAGYKVAWPGFGAFTAVQRPARMGRNPRTGVPVKIQAATAMKFTSSSLLRESLNAKAAAKKAAPAKKAPAKKR
jgi:DNA-binding protein HU-beta